MISLQRSMHSSQMYTPGPAMSFLTCFWLFPQNEHLSRSPPSPMRATGDVSPHPCRSTSASVHCTIRAGRPLRWRRALSRPYPVPGTFGRGHDTNRTSASGRPSHQGRGLARLQDRVDQAVLDRPLGGQDLVALDVEADL